MKFLISRYLLHNQLWVSLMISCLSIFFGLLYGTVDYNRICIVFFSTLAGYNYVGFNVFWKKNLYIKNYFIMFFFSVLFLGWFLWKEHNWELIIHLLFLSIIVFLYNSDFLIIKFRNISFLKIFVISFVWACFVFNIGSSHSFSGIEFLIVFLFIIGITIPFDICDMDTDIIQTLPKLLGVFQSKCLACFCLLSSAILFYQFFEKQIDFCVSWVGSCTFSVLLIVCMRNKDNYFYTRFWMEACSAIPLILYLIQKMRVISI